MKTSDDLLKAFLATLPEGLAPDALALIERAWRAGFSTAESLGYGA